MKFSVGTLGRRIKFDSDARTITFPSAFGFSHKSFPSDGAWVKLDIDQHGRNMNLGLGAANLLRTQKVTVTLTITFPDLTVKQWRVTERGRIIQMYIDQARMFELAVNRANTLQVANFHHPVA